MYPAQVQETYAQGSLYNLCGAKMHGFPSISLKEISRVVCSTHRALQRLHTLLLCQLSQMHWVGSM